MRDVRCGDIERLIANHQESPLKVVSNGELVVLEGEGRVFIYNRLNHKAYELRPEFNFGLTIMDLG